MEPFFSDMEPKSSAAKKLHCSALMTGATESGCADENLVMNAAGAKHVPEQKD